MKHIMTTDPAVTPAQARALLRQWYLATPRTPRTGSASGGSPAAAAGPPGGSSPPGVVLDLARAGSGELEARAWADDRAFLAWADVGGGASVIAAELKARRGWQRLSYAASSQSLALLCLRTSLTCCGSWAAGPAGGRSRARCGKPHAQRGGPRGLVGRAGARAAGRPLPAPSAGSHAARRGRRCAAQ